MSHDTTKQSVLFENLSKKAFIAKFDQDHASSDGGAILLKACDERLQLSAANRSIRPAGLYWRGPVAFLRCCQGAI